MKRFLLFTFLVLSIGLKSFSQEISRSVISSGGGDFNSVFGENIQFTIGQAFDTRTLTDNNGNHLTQGFQQPSSINGSILSPEFPDLELVKMDVYPNPAINNIDIELNMINDKGASVALIDMLGQVVRVQNYSFEKGKQKFNFNFGYLAGSVYTLRVSANERDYSRKLIVNTSGKSSSF